MDQQEQGPDQRKQHLIRRSKEDWEQLACKVLLLCPDYALYLRDNFDWRRDQHDPNMARSAKKLMVRLGIEGTCARSTFSYSITKALRRMQKEACLAREDFNWRDIK